MRDNRDKIDFATEPVGRLFKKMFFPTLVSMISMVVLNITDGAFVGHGVGSDALAAVNIVAPIFMLISGMGLMYGIGSSVVASIHLSKNNQKAAHINLTQGLLAGLVTGIILAAAILVFLKETCYLFGCSEALLPQATSYLRWIAFLSPFNMLGMIGMFAVRLDGSPRFAMVVNCCIALCNIILDYIFVFPLHMGLEGAAIATTISFILGNIPIAIYLFAYTRNIKLYRLRATWKSLYLTLRNIGYQIKIGFSAFLGEIALAAIMILGNYVFMHYLGEDGVAAFSVGCYCFPIVFMLGNAIIQSVQPIISFAYGMGNEERLRKSRNIALKASVLSGLAGWLVMGLGGRIISTTFLDPRCHAYAICCEGMPYFSIAFLFISVNIVLVGYLQSTEKTRQATFFTLLRGFVFSIPCFVLLPLVAVPVGIWLALPLAEALTTTVILIQHRSSFFHA